MKAGARARGAKAGARRGAAPAAGGPAQRRKPAVHVPKYSRPEMKRLLEAVLFAADRPVPISQLCSVLSGSAEADVRGALEEMGREYEEWGRSFVLKEVGGGWLFSTHPAFEPWVRKLFRGRLTLRLSRSALETVALIAYRQPMTKQEVETIRGVNADGVLATLLDRKLIRVTGRKEGSTALLYATTAEFLQYMGLNDLGDLPQLEEMKQILAAQEPGEDGAVPAAPGEAAAVGPYAAGGGEAPAPSAPPAAEDGTKDEGEDDGDEDEEDDDEDEDEDEKP